MSDTTHTLVVEIMARSIFAKELGDPSDWDKAPLHTKKVFLALALDALPQEQAKQP